MKTDEKIKTRVITPDKIANQIRINIITKKYSPKDKIIETDLAKEFNASRNSIRMALKMIESEGLIVSHPNGRREILEFSYKQVIDVYEFRWLLENRALQIIFENKKSFFPLITKVLEEVENISINKDVSVDWYGLDINFHRSLVYSSDNRPIINAWENNAPIIYTLMNLNASKGYKKQYVDEFLEKHKKIYEKIILEDKEAFTLLKTHILDAENIFHSVLESYKNYK